MEYNFTTRQLFPFSDKWENGLQGELWYVWEEDAICIVNGNTHYPMAKGYAAVLLAHKDDLAHDDFKPFDLYKAYNYKLEEGKPKDRHPFEEAERMLQDWRFTLRQLEPFKKDESGYLDRYQRMLVGQSMRLFFNPYNIQDVKDQMRCALGFVCKLKGHEKPQYIFTTMPSVQTLQDAPLIWMRDIDEPDDKLRLQLRGFLAALANYVIYQYWAAYMAHAPFDNLIFLEKFIAAWTNRNPIIDIGRLENLHFVTPINTKEFCQAYMDVYMPMSRTVWERKPSVPIECWDGDKIYSYLYACEQEAKAELLKSELYSHLTHEQQKDIYTYSNRFLEFLTKNYPISSKTQFEVMQAIGRDLPQITLEIHNNVEITRVGQEKQKKEETPIVQNIFNVQGDLVQGDKYEAPAAKPKPAKAPVPRKKKEVQLDKKYFTFKLCDISEGHLQLLRQKLIEVGWIAKDTQPADFSNLFTGKTNNAKITWTGTVGKGMLVCLFTQMVEQQRIAVPDNHSVNTILEHHFVDSEGKYLTRLHSSKPTVKFMPVVKECMNILMLAADAD